LADWYHQPAEAAFADKSILAPTPDSILINNKGRYVGGPASDLAVIGVTSGKRYRFRLVNMSCQTYLTVSIDGHNMTIIEADGQAHQPLVVDSLTIFAGQRYSIIVNANQAVGNYCKSTHTLESASSNSDFCLKGSELFPAPLSTTSRVRMISA